MPSLADRETVPGGQRYVGQYVRAPKTAELIATSYRRQIVRGELRPGDTLPSEQQLMRWFGVSRPTLREAFRILEAENLIDVRRGARGGARVMRPTLDAAARYLGLLLQVQGTTVADVYQARMVVEAACARLLASRRTRADLADLSACAGESRRFHELVMQRSGSTTLAVQGGILRDMMEAHLALATSRGAGHEETLDDVRGHEELVALAEKRDGSRAERHWRAHLEAVGRRLLGEDRPVLDLFG